MKKKYSILFFAAVVILLISEYLFLTELSDTHNWILLIGSAAGLIVSVIVAVLCYIRSAKDTA